MLIPKTIKNFLEKCMENDRKKLSSSRLIHYITPELKSWFEENSLSYSQTKFLLEKCVISEMEDAFNVIIPVCKTCGKQLKDFTNRSYCSKKCACYNSDLKNKRRKTNLEKYGAEYPIQANEIRNKAKQTCLQKYGVEYALQSKEIQNKSKQTLQEKYGVENPFQIEEVKEKIKQTCLEKYDVEHPSYSDAIKDKSKKTNLKKYGVKCTLQSKDIQVKSKKTNLKKYGVEYPTQSYEVKEKTKQTCLERYGENFVLQTKEVRDKIKKSHRKRYYKQLLNLISKKNLELNMLEEEYINKDDFSFKCLKCNTVFETKETNPQKIHCPVCYNQLKSGISNKEREVLEFIRSFYSGRIIKNDREILKGKELDIYLPEKKIAIEFNGNYWHSNLYKERKYHQEKTLACKEQNIRLIHIFEYEWDLKKEKIQDLLKTALGVFEKEVYARNCTCKEISSKEYMDFLEMYHLQNSINSSYRIGLFLNDELLSVMGFGKSRFSKNEYELHRYCTKSGVRIIGGFSKLLSRCKLSSFVSYVDISHFTGESYRKCGFILESITEPNYKWVNEFSILNRFSSQKHKLSKILISYDFNLSENENMLINGYVKIYDSGNLKMRYSIK